MENVLRTREKNRDESASQIVAKYVIDYYNNESM